MSSISPAIKNKDELETILCGGCDRPEENCYCRIVECICCGGTDHRYNMRSNMEYCAEYIVKCQHTRMGMCFVRW